MRVGAVAGRPISGELNPLPPSSSSEPLGSCLHRLAGVVRTAKALAVCRIEGCTAVAEFLDVIRKQPVLRRSLIAAVRILDPLASEAGVDEHLLTPSLMLFGMVDGICSFRLDGDCSSV